jgi:GntR family transcriptional regulator of vanillate catabolism
LRKFVSNTRLPGRIGQGYGGARPRKGSENGVTQQNSTTLRIREMILRGLLQPGERVRELDLAERLGLSRTPIRQALPALAKEGLLVPSGARGYAVRSFDRQESVDALRTRAALEGLAAQLVAVGARGHEAVAQLEPVLEEGDALLRGRRFSDELELQYGAMNERFHNIVVLAAGKKLLVELIARCNIVPFTAPESVTFEHQDQDMSMDLLTYAHHQHHAIVDAIRAHDGLRAEMLFREHALTQEKSLRMGPWA